jgi:MFS family permease
MTRGQALSAVVLIHLAISIVHGQAHTGAQVPLPLAGTLFVYIVILAGPIVGLVVSRWRLRAGASIVAASMAGALVFGLINHFIIDGSDHVAHVAAAWRTQFGITAVLLAVSEAAGVAVGVYCRRKKSDLDVGDESLTLGRQERTS